ncbi:hypothetical protein E3N88_41498 [Mikania micrantha]|uniref:Pentatricopeptide repeat-containing protein n=1 Tax=Mikania micrantha TaxID=192012 RepID=A0A5N6LKF9_9ASTR|nr:hypothetical protein E3N88_41498 [Mikania micrantha]
MNLVHGKKKSDCLLDDEDFIHQIQVLTRHKWEGLIQCGRLIQTFSHDVSPDVVTYGILIDACCHEDDIKYACKLFDEMLERGLSPSVVVYTTLIRGFCSEGRMLEAESMFADMSKAGVIPSLYTYNVLLDGHCKMANVDKALDVYREILIAGLNPNFVTFGILVDMCCKMNSTLAAESCLAQMMKFALDLLAEMEMVDTANDVFTYCILINGYCNMGRLKEADDLLKEMNRKGIDANSAVYNALINGYSKNGNMVKALELCGQMVVNGVEVNVITYSTLIDGYCKVKDMGSAMGLYTEMVIKGLVPDIVAYTALIDGYFKDCNMKAALRVYNEMIEAGLTPNVFTLGCLIDGFCKDGLTNDAIKIFLDNMQHFPPNNVLYTSLIHGLCNNGQIFKASKFFTEMRSIGLKPDVELYAVITQWHFKTKHVHDVTMLHADMLKMGVIPNDIIYGVFARGYREIKDYKSAFRCSDDLLPVACDLHPMVMGCTFKEDERNGRWLAMRGRMIGKSQWKGIIEISIGCGNLGNGVGKGLLIKGQVTGNMNFTSDGVKTPVPLEIERILKKEASD